MRSLPTIRLLGQYTVLALMVSSCARGYLSDEFEQLVRPDEFLRDSSIVLGSDTDTCLVSVAEEWPDFIPENLLTENLCYPQATMLEARVPSEEAVSQYWREYWPTDGVEWDTETQQRLFQIIWETSNSFDEVRNFYRNSFEKAGWYIRSANDNLSVLGISGEGSQILVRPIGSDFPLLDSIGSDKTTEDTDVTNFSELIQVNRSDAADMLLKYALLYSRSPDSFEGQVSGEYTSDLQSDLVDTDEGVLVPPESDFVANDDNLVALDEHIAEGTNNTDLEDSVEQEELQAGDEGTLHSEFAGSLVNVEDIGEAPDILEAYIQEFVALGIVQQGSDEPQRDSLDNNNQLKLFRPNDQVTRREYARWLFLANNLFNSDRPGQLLRNSDQKAEPVFQDILPSDPDFRIIQGLAEAGLIPSILTNPSTPVWFGPDDPLTREDLIAWKAPLDIQGALPETTVEDIEQSWGFQDAATINSTALSAIWLDYQNADASNIRRAFGYTRLFQPEKTVTRAEAAAVLWYFGSQSEGRSARTLFEDVNTGTADN